MLQGNSEEERMVLWFSVPLYICGLITLAIGIFSAIWGDRFLEWFLRIFRYL